jgi:hypothetical protein
MPVTPATAAPSNKMIFMVTRRNTLLAALGFPGALALFGASQDLFWDQKDPKDWTPDQVQELLTRSPWAKTASVSFFNNGPGGYGAGIGGRTGAGLGNVGRTSQRSSASGRGGAAPDTASDPGTFRAMVRWESSKPIKTAQKSRAADGDAGFYILALIGEIPDFARPSDEETTEAREQRVAMLREFTRLERKGGGPIYLERLEPGANGTLFYFSRFDPITPANKEITFTTKMGPLEIKAKFTLKDMLYKGKLEL